MTQPKRPPAACKDCWSAIVADLENQPAIRKWRPATHPGPRCTTHHRAKRAADKKRSAERRDKSVYGLMPGGHAELQRAQGGKCAICRRATGASRRLSVDHDHATDAVRGLLCRPCNSMLGHGRDDPEFFLRAIAYLENPPANLLGDEWFTRKEDQ